MVYTIVVTYNATPWLDKCFGSLITSEMNYELCIIAIDNASTDNTVEYLKERYPQIELVVNKENLGFGQANNIGIRKAIQNGADYVFLLNQDAWIDEYTIERLVNLYKKNPQYGVLSPLQLTKEGNIEPQFSKYLPLEQGDNDIFDVHFVNAASWLISSETIKKVGLFDSFFFHYGEDNNYCNRLRYFGYTIGIAKNVSIVHDRNYGTKAIEFNFEMAIKGYLTDISRSYTNCLLRLFIKSTKLFIKYIFTQPKVFFKWLKTVYSVLSETSEIMKSRKRAFYPKINDR